MLLLMAGCDIGTADPLLYDEGGELRLEVGADEVAAAGISESCSEIDLQVLTETVRVPVEGDDGVELVGVGGLALCLDEEGEEGEDDDLPGLDDLGGLDDDHVLTVDLEGTDEGEDESTTNDSSTNVDVNHDGSHTSNNQELRPPPTVLADPTPEPVGE